MVVATCHFVPNAIKGLVLPPMDLPPMEATQQRLAQFTADRSINYLQDLGP